MKMAETDLTNGPNSKTNASIAVVACYVKNCDFE